MLFASNVLDGLLRGMSLGSFLSRVDNRLEKLGCERSIKNLLQSSDQGQRECSETLQSQRPLHNSSEFEAELTVKERISYNLIILPFATL